MFQYLTLRTILSVLTALGLSLLVGPVMIRRLTALQIGQAVRQDGPQSHLSKAGTPTMGGALIIVAMLLATVLWGDLSNRYVVLAALVVLAFGAVGWVDDYRKVVERNSRGLPARWKYFWQTVLIDRTIDLYPIHLVLTVFGMGESVLQPSIVSQNE